MDWNLNLRPRESRQHDDHPQSGLHCGFGLRISQVDHTPKPSDAFGSRMLRYVVAQFRDVNQAGMKE
jgi:hypothetical protein